MVLTGLSTPGALSGIVTPFTTMTGKEKLPSLSWHQLSSFSPPLW